MRHDAFTKQLEASYLGLDKAAPVIGARPLPDFPAKPVRGRKKALRSLEPRRWFFHGLAFLQTGIIAYI
jgi:hypothetical protein